MQPLLMILWAVFALGGDPASGGAVDPWLMPQDPSHPWKGTPQASIADHRNGASSGGLAVFSDPRWAGRAVAIALRDFHHEGARSAADYAKGLREECRRLGAASCPAADLAPRWSATLAVAPDAALDLFDVKDQPTARLRPALTALATAMGGGAPTSDQLDAAQGAVADSDLNQGEAGFRLWLARDPARPAAVAAFESRLRDAGVLGVAPTWQILRTASDWRGCGAPFDVPPAEAQANIVPTLKLVRARIAPALGPLEARSAYRGPWMNICTGGAERSAHREFSAVDLTPETPMTRAVLMARLCPIYASYGEEERLGLGFYAGVRFHVDTQRHRSWASENGRAYGPCSPAGKVNPPLPPLPTVGPPLPPAPPSR